MDKIRKNKMEKYLLTLLENAQFMNRLRFAFHNPFWPLVGYACNHGYCELDTIFIQYNCIGVYNGILYNSYVHLHGLGTFVALNFIQ